jgi:hypothetical protein
LFRTKNFIKIIVITRLPEAAGSSEDGKFVKDNATTEVIVAIFVLQ